jgi:glyoxylase-like metal-dependent hydrolase (beta-lactamase superfamily II)
VKLTEHIELFGSGQMGFNLTNPLDCNVYLIHDGDDAVIVDAGAGVDIEPILGQIDQFSIPRDSIRRLLLTHAHPDHAGGARALHDALGVGVYASPLVASYVRNGDEGLASFDRLCGPGGYPDDYTFAPCPVAGELREGDRITIGRLAIEVVETPGHCGGHLSFALHRPDGIDLFSGDAIFTRGRILLQNIWDCSVADSCESVERLASVRPDGLFPGHGTVSIERGWIHIYSAMESIGSMLPPPQLA